MIHAHQHAPSNYVAGYGEEGIAAHDAIDIIKKGPAHAHEVNIEHPFWLSAPALERTRHGQGPAAEPMRRSRPAFLNNIGIGLQFAAVGAAVFSEAKAKGIGREIPTDWFLESVHP